MTHWLRNQPSGETARSGAESYRREIEDNIFFYIVASASFVEITSHIYTHNLVGYFEGDDEIAGWLRQTWEQEELGHGARLRDYVLERWPGFDWGRAYANFTVEFAPHCVPAELAPSRGRELAALCVVETGTASLYKMIADASDEPRLQAIATAIGGEEIGHYKQFLRHFRRYREIESLSLWDVLKAFLAQVKEIEGVDAFYAFKHVYLTRNPGVAFDREMYNAFRHCTRKIARHHFPSNMAIKMLLKMLPIPRFFQRAAVVPLVSMWRLLVL